MKKNTVNIPVGALFAGNTCETGTTVPIIKTTHGITLIALVITIIILLILAGITINLTLGEHGIIKMAEKAGKNYVNVAEDEQKKLGDLLNEANNIINGTGNYTDKTDTSKTLLANEVSIGDYVEYNPTLGVTDTTKLIYESQIGTGSSHGNGYGVQKFTANSNTKWKVLSANKATGEVVLISESPIQTDATQEFYINGSIGYLYAEQELNNICKIYGYGKGADTTKQFTCEIGDTVDGVQQITITGSGARSININDINQTTGYTEPQEQAQTCNMYYPTLLQQNGRSLTDKSQNRTTTLYVYKGEDYLNTSNEMYKILFGNSTKFNNYWIANRCVWLGTATTGANFFTNRVFEGEVTAAINVAIWNGVFTDSSFSCGIRPVVYLKTNIETTGKNENGEWKIY